MSKKKEEKGTSTAQMVTYEVAIPITGVAYTNVVLPVDADEDAIFEAATDAINEEIDKGRKPYEWEFTREVVSGNVSHAHTNEWDYTKVVNKEEEEE